MPKTTTYDTETLELHLLMEGIYQRYGYDFREYAPDFLRRRVEQCVQVEQLTTISGFQEKVLHDPVCMERFILAMSGNGPAMFGDPAFYVAFREKVTPDLRELPFIRVWYAGCSTGEDVYALAIVLTEEGLYDRCRIYATDFNAALLKKAKAGTLPLRAVQAYTTNYQRAGGQGVFSDYYSARDENAMINQELRKYIVFGQHNLVTDASFNEFHVILCQNVMLSFNDTLRARVHKLLYESLASNGVMGLGSSDSLQFIPHEVDYETVDEAARLYRKIR